MIKAIIAFFTMVILGMMGGQGKIGGKNTRRYGLPAVAVAFAIWWDGFQLKDLLYLLLIPVLVLGYGEHSHLYNMLFQSDTLVRIVYAFLLTIPFAFYGLIRWVISAMALVLAFQVHAGSLANFSWFGDILIEDIVRYSTLAGLVIGNTIWRKKA